MNKVFFGDCRDSLRQLAEDGVKVQMCVTSPPYFGLRDYGHEGQIGLEETPEQYIAAMVTVFREVGRVLADDGTLWVNIGDTYASAWPCSRRNVIGSGSLENGKRENRPPRMGQGLKEKDLIGIPWMLAFALRADGWYLRQDIIWNKPNPMPEAVTDRCTKSHEYVFLLTKQKRYFYDHEAVKEDAVGGQTGAAASFKREGSKRAQAIPGQSAGTHRADREDVQYNGEKRNRRSVWSVATRPYKGAHFAVFPPALVEPCILAGSRPGDIILDPFMGSGTTAAVAIEHGRSFIGCELNIEYKPLQDQRITEARSALAEAEAERTRQVAQFNLFDEVIA